MAQIADHSPLAKRDPLNPLFNDWIIDLSTALFPYGFDVRVNAPNTAADLSATMRMGRMVVWDSDYSTSDIADTETHRAFRALHDWAHWRYDLPFTMAGEYAACHVHTSQIIRYFGRNEGVERTIAQLWANIISTLEYVADHDGAYPADQHAFVEANIETWLPLARLLLERQGASDIHALKTAEGFEALREEAGGCAYCIPIPRPTPTALPAELANLIGVC